MSNDYVKALDGSDLPVKKDIYNDTPNIGDKQFAINCILSGQLDDYTEKARAIYLKRYGISDSEYQTLLHQRRTNKVFGR